MSARLNLPNRAKPSKVAGQDRTRPMLQHGHVQEVDGHRELHTCDSYHLASITVPDDVPLGVLSGAALKRIEAGEVAEIGDDCQVEVVDKRTRAKVLFPTPDLGEAKPPAFASLYPDAKPKQRLVRIGLNAGFLKNCADALGVNSAHEGVILEVLLDEDDTTLTAMVVRPQRDVETGKNGRRGLVMPIRVVRS